MTYTAINLKKIEEGPLPDVIRSAAIKLAEKQYMSIGSFLSQLSKADLKELVSFANSITLGIDAGQMLEYLILLAEMLTQAEGCDLDESVALRTGNLMILLTFEDLSRKGVIDFARESATLSGNLDEVPNLAKLR